MTATSPATARPRRKARGRRPMSRRRRVVVVIGAVLALALGFASIYPIVIASTFEQNVETFPTSFPDDRTRPAPAEGDAERAQTILLLGADTRGELPDDIDTPEASLTDVMMLVHVSGDRERADVISLPRDTWVDIPGYGPGKMNWAFAIGGAAKTVETVEAMLDVRIDRVVAIDFEGFKGLTEALGGVTVQNPTQFTRYGFDYPVGDVYLSSGEMALAFVRERQLLGGDAARVQNQQAYLRAILESILSADTLSNPGRVLGVVEAISPYLRVDEGFSAGYVAGLAAESSGLRTSDITFSSLPISGGGFEGDHAVAYADQRGIGALSRALREDDLAGYSPPPPTDERNAEG